MKKIRMRIKSFLCMVIMISVSMPAYSALPMNAMPRPELKKAPHSLDSDFFVDQVWEQGERYMYIDRLVRTVLFMGREARDITPEGTVADSWFFENRIGEKVMTSDEVKKGNVVGTGPDMTQPWTVIKAKSDSGGKSTGFFIKDVKGDKYLLKLDHYTHPEMNSSAEVICSRLLHAIGYYVPEYTVVYFPFEQLQLKEGLHYTDDNGFKRPVTLDVLKSILSSSAINAKNQYRASASKFVDGKVLGPMSLRGRRRNDPQDGVAHEDRRELRGLRVFSSWLNHFDMRRGNTMDVLIETSEGWAVKHYLIDFGSTLGAFIAREKTPEQGHEYIITVQEILKSILTFGFYKRPWIYEDIRYAQTGYFTNVDFDPRTWKPQIPNYAFQNMTVDDAVWAVTILRSITDAHIIAAVEAGQITKKTARDDLIQKLIERRDVIVNYWLEQSK